MSKCPVPEHLRATHPLFGGIKPVNTEDNKSSETTATPSTPSTTTATVLTPATSDNMMPPPNQRRGPGQNVDLPTSRVRSTIPRGDFTPGHQENASGSDGSATTKPREDTETAATTTNNKEDEPKWVYPSEQMFFNAMKRKGWGPKEEEMPVVVSIHNAVNERAWGEVMKWERMHDQECDCPKLFKFMGRPKDLSPRTVLVLNNVFIVVHLLMVAQLLLLCNHQDFELTHFFSCTLSLY